jgi:hypothetical protein
VNHGQVFAESAVVHELGLDGRWVDALVVKELFDVLSDLRKLTKIMSVVVITCCKNTHDTSVYFFNRSRWSLMWSLCASLLK